MTFYVVLWLLFYALGVYFMFSQRRASYGIVVAILVVVAYCVACRVDVGADWESYVSLYNTNMAGDGRDIIEIEPLFRLSRDLFFSLGFSYQVFFFFFSFISMYALVRVAKSFNVDNYPLFFLVYISLSFCAFQLNLMRIGIMCSCLWMALSYRNESLVKTLLWMAIGTGFHYLCLINLPVVLIANKNLASKWFFIIIGASLIALLTNIGVKIVDSIPFLSTLGRASDYLDPDSSFRNGNGVTIGLLFNICFCTYLRLKYRKQYSNNQKFRILINMVLFAIVFSCWLNGIGIVALRGGQCMNTALCFIWALLLAKKQGEKRILWVVFLTAYLFMFYMKNFSSEDRNLVPFKIAVASIYR